MRVYTRRRLEAHGGMALTADQTRPQLAVAYVSCDASRKVAEIALDDWKATRLIDAGKGADGRAAYVPFDAAGVTPTIRQSSSTISRTRSSNPTCGSHPNTRRALPASPRNRLISAGR